MTTIEATFAVGDRVRVESNKHLTVRGEGFIERVGLYSCEVRLDNTPDVLTTINMKWLEVVEPPLDPPEYAPCQPVLILGAARDFVGVVEAYEPEHEHPYFVWLYQPVGGKWHGFWYSAEQLTPFVPELAGVTVAEVDALNRRVAAMAARLETRNAPAIASAS